MGAVAANHQSGKHAPNLSSSLSSTQTMGIYMQRSIILNEN